MKKWLGFFGAAVLLIAALAILPIHGEAGIYDNVIRLHVLANSDSEEDQALKLMVRDAVVKESERLLEGVGDRDAAERILRESLPDLKATAEQALASAGATAEVSVTLTEESYPTREYEQLAFPAGKYLSLRVSAAVSFCRNRCARAGDRLPFGRPYGRAVPSDRRYRQYQIQAPLQNS